MSADNWGMCPKCKTLRDTEQRKNEQAMREAYGKVTPEEYEELREVANADVKLEHSLREDYEQGMNDKGEYYVRYSCSCDVCGFSWKFKYDEIVKL